MGTCHDIQDLELNPLSISSAEINEQDICSPDETSTSYSESLKFLLIFLDNFIKNDEIKSGFLL